MSSPTSRPHTFSRVSVAVVSMVFAGVLGGCEGSKDTTPIDQSKMEAVDLVADVLYYASRGSNGPHFTWGKQGDTFISTNGNGYVEKVKVTARGPCLYFLEYSIDSGNGQPQQGSYTADFAKLKKFTNLASTATTGPSSAALILEGERGLVCFRNEDNCSRAKWEQKYTSKEYADRAANSFRELSKRFCTAAAVAQVVTTEPPPRKWDGTRAPTTAEIQEAWNRQGKSVRVTSSSCVLAGAPEWRCQVVYEVFINNPQQLMLAGTYENTYSAVYSLQNGELRITRDYQLINQRRI